MMTAIDCLNKLNALVNKVYDTYNQAYLCDTPDRFATIPDGWATPIVPVARAVPCKNLEDPSRETVLSVIDYLKSEIDEWALINEKTLIDWLIAGCLESDLKIYSAQFDKESSLRDWCNALEDALRDAKPVGDGYCAMVVSGLKILKSLGKIRTIYSPGDSTKWLYIEPRLISGTPIA